MGNSAESFSCSLTKECNNKMTEWGYGWDRGRFTSLEWNKLSCERTNFWRKPILCYSTVSGRVWLSTSILTFPSACYLHSTVPESHFLSTNPFLNNIWRQCDANYLPVTLMLLWHKHILAERTIYDLWRIYQSEFSDTNLRKWVLWTTFCKLQVWQCYI